MFAGHTIGDFLLTVRWSLHFIKSGLDIHAKVKDKVVAVTQE